MGEQLELEPPPAGGGPAGWTTGDAWYQHPGFAAVDHQLEPLMDAIRAWAEPPFGTLEHAYEAIEAVRVAMTQLRRNLKEEATDRAFAQAFRRGKP